MVFGENTLAPILKTILKLDVEGGYSSGRYRDIHVKRDTNTDFGYSIVLYTRNGGGKELLIKSYKKL
jgi:hypothetical protein